MEPKDLVYRCINDDTFDERGHMVIDPSLAAITLAMICTRAQTGGDGTEGAGAGAAKEGRDVIDLQAPARDVGGFFPAPHTGLTGRPRIESDAYRFRV
jgi:hypothetical protein